MQDLNLQLPFLVDYPIGSSTIDYFCSLRRKPDIPRKLKCSEYWYIQTQFSINTDLIYSTEVEFKMPPFLKSMGSKKTSSTVLVCESWYCKNCRSFHLLDSSWFLRSLFSKLTDLLFLFKVSAKKFLLLLWDAIETQHFLCMQWNAGRTKMPENVLSLDMLRFSKSLHCFWPYLLHISVNMSTDSFLLEADLLFLNIKEFVFCIGIGILIDQIRQSAIGFELSRYSIYTPRKLHIWNFYQCPNWWWYFFKCLWDGTISDFVHYIGVLIKLTSGTSN